MHTLALLVVYFCDNWNTVRCFTAVCARLEQVTGDVFTLHGWWHSLWLGPPTLHALRIVLVYYDLARRRCLFYFILFSRTGVDVGCVDLNNAKANCMIIMFRIL